MLREHVTVVEDLTDNEVPRARLYGYQGSGLEVTIDVVDVVGDPVDLTGRDVRSQVRRYPGAPELDAQFTVDLTDAAVGRVRLLLGPADTRPLFGVYRYDVKTSLPTVPAGTSVLVAGSLEVDAEVTR